MTGDTGASDAGLRDYLALVWRHKWIVVLAAALVTGAAVGFSLRQQHLYRASAQVLLSRQAPVVNLGSDYQPSLSDQPDRVVQTQADLARVPLVAVRTLRAARVTDRTPGEFLARSSVHTKTDSDLLSFNVTDPAPLLARALATAYARQYTIYRRQLDTGAIKRALTEVDAKIYELELEGDKKSPLYASLVDKQQILQTALALQTSNAFVVKVAGDAAQVQPRPTRNGVLGVFLGLVLGLGLVFLREALDTRVKTAEAIRHRLKLPLLGRLPEPPRRLQKDDRLAMLHEPESSFAEMFRMLRTNVEFANMNRKARTIMVTSSVQGEGKSTTVANLAVALARAGRRVVLVDLDLRRPYLHKFFPLPKRAGVTEVALGYTKLDDALLQVPLTDAGTAAARKRSRNATASGNGAARVQGMLEVLCTGPIPPDPGEFVGSPALGEILEQLAERADVVLIDSPPLLSVGDALTLSERVEAMIVLTRLKVVKRPMLNELKRILDATPAEKLGFIVTAAGEEDAYGYGYGYAYRYERKEEREQIRV